MCAVPDMAAFCSSLTSCFPGMLLTYFLNDFHIVSVAPIFTGITFAFTFHIRCISIVRPSYINYYYYYYYYYYVYRHKCFLLDTSPLEPIAIPTAQSSSPDCSTFHIMCDIPSTAAVCVESTECFPGVAYKFFPKPFVAIPVAPIVTGIILHSRSHIRCNSIHKLLYFTSFSASFRTSFLSACYYIYECTCFLFFVYNYYYYYYYYYRNYP